MDVEEIASSAGGRHIWPVTTPPLDRWTTVEAEGFDVTVDDAVATRDSLDDLKQLLSRYVAHYEDKLLNAKRKRKFLEAQRDATRFELERAKQELTQLQNAGPLPPPEAAPKITKEEKTLEVTKSSIDQEILAEPSEPLWQLAEQAQPPQPLPPPTSLSNSSTAIPKPPTQKLGPSQDWASAVSPQPPPAKPKPKPKPNDSWVVPPSLPSKPKPPQQVDPWGRSNLSITERSEDQRQPEPWMLGGSTIAERREEWQLPDPWMPRSNAIAERCQEQEQSDPWMPRGNTIVGKYDEHQQLDPWMPRGSAPKAKCIEHQQPDSWMPRGNTVAERYDAQQQSDPWMPRGNATAARYEIPQQPDPWMPRGNAIAERYEAQQQPVPWMLGVSQTAESYEEQDPWMPLGNSLREQSEELCQGVPRMPSHSIISEKIENHTEQVDIWGLGNNSIAVASRSPEQYRLLHQEDPWMSIHSTLAERSERLHQHESWTSQQSSPNVAAIDMPMQNSQVSWTSANRSQDSYFSLGLGQSSWSAAVPVPPMQNACDEWHAPSGVYDRGMPMYTPFGVAEVLQQHGHSWSVTDDASRSVQKTQPELPQAPPPARKKKNKIT